MNVALCAEVRRLKKIEKLSERKIALRLQCSRHSVAKALRLEQPPTTEAVHRGSLLEPYLIKIEALVMFDADNTLATALIDRLMHHGEALVIQGKSYRMRDKDSDSPSA